MDSFTTVLEVAGLVLLAISAFMVAPALGLAVSGVFLLLVGVILGEG